MWNRLKNSLAFNMFAIYVGIFFGAFVAADFIVPGVWYCVESETRWWTKVFEARRERWKQEDATAELEEAK